MPSLEERATEILRNDKRLKVIAREAVMQAIREIWDVGLEAPVKISDRALNRALKECQDPFLPS